MKEHRKVGFTDKLYEFWQSQVNEAEREFYRQALKRANGKALELAAAGGRLFLPFLSEGFQIEAVEASNEMFSLLHQRAEKMKLVAQIYKQSIESLEVVGPYKLIYIPLGSFQFIPRFSDAKLALQKYYELLSDRGELIIPLYLPFTDINPSELGLWQILADFNNRKRKERVVKREIVHHDPLEQIISAQVRLELWSEKDLLEMTEKMVFLRWYSRNEFSLLLSQIGFKSVDCLYSYKVKGSPIPSLMLFIAKK